MRDGFVKVAAGTPKIRVAHCRYNAEACFTLMRQAAEGGVSLLSLPELCLTGATCGDLFFQDTLLRGAEEGLSIVLEATRGLDLLAVLGLPVARGGKLYNCGAVICRGVLLGVVPKGTISPGQGRHFSPGGPRSGGVTLCGQTAPFGTDLLFSCDSLPELVVGVTLGEELSVVPSPAEGLALCGATVLLSLSAREETVGRAACRRTLFSNQSARLHCGLVHAAAGEGESSTDFVYAGHNLIAENGVLLAERRFGTGLVVTELDVARLHYARRRDPLWSPEPGDCPKVPFPLDTAVTTLTRTFSPTPFLPQDQGLCRERCEEILLLAALGLKTRLEHTGAKCCVVGLSGGLDSTLAVLITTLALGLCDRPASDIVAVTMPCFGTTDRTRENAQVLATRLGATLRRIDLSASVRSHLRDIGQPPDLRDVTYENAQARERTQVLMDIANQTGGLVIGTGDLSELALGFCTYNGDHMSMYAPCAGIPKTMVRHLVSYVSGDKEAEDPALATVLADILDTPISPELLPAIEGKIAQKTEDLVGPYELHDFFLYYAVRWGFSPKKVLRLAGQAFGPRYDRATLLRWAKHFYRRFFSQQFKRSCLPDGPKVGSVGLSPRGEWVMPSDAVSALWLAELEELGE